ncbi:MAG: FAD:protein FMN transferase [Flavobacteriaceae bacterium]|nr:FAD:protein FMN transferase [Flavobacteriaceae bacterium]
MKKLILVFILIIFYSCKNSAYKTIVGNAFGTTYHIKLKNNSKINWHLAIDSLVSTVNKSLSTYINTSDISKINQGNTTIIVDKKFKEVFNKSKRIFKETNGVFDPTIGVLVNAWDFGPEKKLKKLDSSTIKKLIQQVGFEKVKITNNKVIKENENIYLDFNAIAKGYGIDIIGRFFEKKNITNYMIELGGELRVRGKNPKNLDWKIQIESPNFDGSRSSQKIITLHNESMATSGTYRHFKIAKNGSRYAHILNTKTGYPSKSNLLSASVIANLDCADVDAYATTLMALGLEKSKLFLKKHQELKAFLIYNDTAGNLQTFQTSNF